MAAMKVLSLRHTLVRPTGAALPAVGVMPTADMKAVASSVGRAAATDESGPATGQIARGT